MLMYGCHVGCSSSSSFLMMNINEGRTTGGSVSMKASSTFANSLCIYSTCGKQQHEKKHKTKQQQKGTVFTPTLMTDHSCTQEKSSGKRKTNKTKQSPSEI